MGRNSKFGKDYNDEISRWRSLKGIQPNPCFNVEKGAKRGARGAPRRQLPSLRGGSDLLTDQ